MGRRRVQTSGRQPAYRSPPNMMIPIITTKMHPQVMMVATYGYRWLLALVISRTRTPLLCRLCAPQGSSRTHSCDTSTGLAHSCSRISKASVPVGAGWTVSAGSR